MLHQSAQLTGTACGPLSDIVLAPFAYAVHANRQRETTATTEITTYAAQRGNLVAIEQMQHAPCRNSKRQRDPHCPVGRGCARSGRRLFPAGATRLARNGAAAPLISPRQR